jgi:uncharacterized membrane protein
MKQLLIAFLAVVIVIIAATTSSCKHEITTTNAVIPIDTTKKDTTKTTGGTGTVVVVDKGDTTGWKCSADTIYFLDVLPIFISACAGSGCHDAATKAKNYQLTDYANIIKRGVVAGNANNSTVYAEIANGSMPPRSSGIVMTAAQKALIANWINKGAKNYVCNANYGKCDTTTAVSFASFVKPIMENRCQGCHSGTLPSGNLSLTTYAQIKASAITPAFMGSMRRAAGFSFMPKGGTSLTACELNKLEAWIKRGALNN